MWLVQTGRYENSYKTTYSFKTYQQALFYFQCLNTFNGYKKRLIHPDGRTIHRYIS